MELPLAGRPACATVPEATPFARSLERQTESGTKPHAIAPAPGVTASPPRPQATPHEGSTAPGLAHPPGNGIVASPGAAAKLTHSGDSPAMRSGDGTNPVPGTPPQVAATVSARPPGAPTPGRPAQPAALLPPRKRHLLSLSGAVAISTGPTKRARVDTPPTTGTPTSAAGSVYAVSSPSAGSGGGGSPQGLHSRSGPVPPARNTSAWGSAPAYNRASALVRDDDDDDTESHDDELQQDCLRQGCTSVKLQCKIPKSLVVGRQPDGKVCQSTSLRCGVHMAVCVCSTHLTAVAAAAECFFWLRRHFHLDLRKHHKGCRSAQDMLPHCRRKLATFPGITFRDGPVPLDDASRPSQAPRRGRPPMPTSPTGRVASKRPRGGRPLESSLPAPRAGGMAGMRGGTPGGVVRSPLPTQRARLDAVMSPAARGTPGCWPGDEGRALVYRDTAAAGASQDDGVYHPGTRRATAASEGPYAVDTHSANGGGSDSTGDGSTTAAAHGVRPLHAGWRVGDTPTRASTAAAHNGGGGGGGSVAALPRPSPGVLTRRRRPSDGGGPLYSTPVRRGAGMLRASGVRSAQRARSLAYGGGGGHPDVPWSDTRPQHAAWRHSRGRAGSWTGQPPAPPAAARALHHPTAPFAAGGTPTTAATTPPPAAQTPDGLSTPQGAKPSCGNNGAGGQVTPQSRTAPTRGIWLADGTLARAKQLPHTPPSARALRIHASAARRSAAMRGQAASRSLEASFHAPDGVDGWNHGGHSDGTTYSSGGGSGTAITTAAVKPRRRAKARSVAARRRTSSISSDGKGTPSRLHSNDNGNGNGNSSGNGDAALLGKSGGFDTSAFDHLVLMASVAAQSTKITG